MLTKAIPILLLAGLTVKGATMGKDQLAFFTNYTKIVATQHEIQNICTVIHMELADYGYLPSEDDWIDAVRAQYDLEERDPVIDLWGNYYGYWPDYPRDFEFAVLSAGPDGAYDTQDDISSRNKKNYEKDADAAFDDLEDYEEDY